MEIKKQINLDLIAILISILAVAGSFYTFYYQTIHISEKSLIRINRFDLAFEKNKMNFDLEASLINHGNTDILLEELAIEVLSYDSTGNFIGRYRYDFVINEVVGVKKIHLKHLSDVTYAFYNQENSLLEGLSASQRLLLAATLEGAVDYTITGGTGSRASGRIEGLQFKENEGLVTVTLSTVSLQQPGVELTIGADASMDSTRSFEQIKVDESFKVDF